MAKYLLECLLCIVWFAEESAARVQNAHIENVIRKLDSLKAGIPSNVIREIFDDEMLVTYQLSLGLTRERFKLRHAKAHLNRVYAAIDKLERLFLFEFLEDVSSLFSSELIILKLK